jgi:hypothetical protein
MARNIATDGIDDITLKDLKRGYHIYEGKKYEILSSVNKLKDLKYGQLFKIPNSKGEITSTFSASSGSRYYNRVWMKVPRGYRGLSDSVPRGFALVVPYDDPKGESNLIKLTQKVLAFNVVDYGM